MAEDVLVIGAGPAGIASAYFLARAGLTYRLVDQAAVIASTWADLYPSLRLNTTRFYSHLPGRKFPLSFGIFPTGKQFHQYLQNYVWENRIPPHLGVTVHRAWPEAGGWQVETSEGNTWYPAIISATGRFSCPVWPTIPGMERFGGQLLHAHDYRGPESFRGKRVMVVGNGPSGVDISAELGRYAQRPVLLAQRTGVVLRPRYPWGLPKHVWMMLAELLPETVGGPLIQRISDLKFEHLDQWGIKIPRDEQESSAAGATRGRELINAVRAGQVRCVDGPTRFHDTSVELADGSRHVVDCVILATGYRPALFQHIDLNQAVLNRDGWPMRVDEPPGDSSRGKREVRGYPGLYLVGVYYLGKGALHNIGIEAEAAVSEIRQRLQSLANQRVTVS